MFWKKNNIPASFAASTQLLSPSSVTRGLTRVHKRCCLALGIACVIFFDHSPTKSVRSNWSTRCSLTNLIGWLWHNRWISFAWLFRSAQVGQKSFFEWVVLNAPVLGQFLSDFDRVKSNVSSRPSLLKYPQEIFDRTTPLKDQTYAFNSTATCRGPKPI